MTEPIIFGQPLFDEEELNLVTSTLQSMWIGQGPLVAEFERRLGEAVWSDQVVAVSSCTAALELALLALGIGEGDEVVTTALTFVATVNAIGLVGAKPVLADIDPDSLLLTPEAAEKAMTGRTRAIIPVSFGGRPLDLAGFLRVADERDVLVIEDAAHAIGAVADRAPVGASRHPRLITCFSFYPNKNLASAEGGALCLTDPDLAGRLRSLRLHGLDSDAWSRYRDRGFTPSLAQSAGRKANWTDLQAAIALPQLAKLPGFLASREHLATVYDERLVSHPDITIVDRPTPSLVERHALHLYQVRVPAHVRDPVVHQLRTEGIGLAVHYPAIHRHPWFQGLDDGDLHQAERAGDELISLPLHPGMAERQVDRVAGRLRQALETPPP